MAIEDSLIILNNERDRRTWEWLKATVETERLLQAISNLSGKRKPYVSNICKALNVEPPEEIILGMSENDYAHMHMERAKAALRAKKP